MRLQFAFIFTLAAAAPALAQTASGQLFTERVEPVLSANCYGCHSSRLSSPRSGLVLDTKAGLSKGGNLGQDVIPGKPAESRLLEAIRYTSNLQMPPKGKLPESAIADIEQWIASGAVDPRGDGLAAALTPADELFEKKIRPVLVANCFSCHSSTRKAPMGGLSLDTKAGLAKGGSSGPAVVPGKPDESRMLQALTYSNNTLQMPPSGKLADSVIADFRQWIAAGAPDPRKDVAAASGTPTPLKGMSIADGRKWWSFQPVKELPAPKVQDAAWVRGKLDAFILAKLEQNRLKPSPQADKRTLVTRAYLDLVGVKPTYAEIEAFTKDTTPVAYEKLIDRLLASPHYGERWGRHWLDVARFAEDNSTSEATNPPFAFAWRYRDWVIEAINKDVPYNQFVKLQMAADMIPGTPRDDYRALGYLGVAPVYHKEPRLSQEVLYTFATDDWDERVDAVGRGLLGMTLGCARCHDHKFDPIKQTDYYALAGMFASTMRAERPLRADIDPKVETRYLWIAQRLFDMNVIMRILSGEKQTSPEWAAKRVEVMQVEVTRLQAEVQSLNDRYPELVAHLMQPKTAASRAGVPSEEPFANAVYDAALYVDGKDPYMTEMDYRPGEARDLPVFKSGNVANPGEIVPRHFPAVLSKSEEESKFRQGSGRLEFTEKVFTDAAPLSARVIVNRVWDWHFGKPLVGTASDFGVQGETPTHPELLDDLAARFIAHGWSLKWLNREIMLSAAYRQSSSPRADAEQADSTNKLLWHMNPRRLDVEAYRDSIMNAAGTLNEKLYGPSIDFDDAANDRRTVYARVSRGKLNPVLRLYDFPDPMQTSPGRDLTTTPLQQLFVMNSAFIQKEAEALANSVANEADNAAKIRILIQKILLREATPKELDLGMTYLSQATLAQYAQALLATNEVIFWP